MPGSTPKPTDTGPGAKADATASLPFSAPGATVWLEIMNESVRFFTERLQQDLETQRAMLDCKSPAELMRLQTEFYRGAISDYTAEATRMFGLMSRAMSGTLDEATGPQKRKYDDIPL